jgi:hypothetical protein
MPDPNPLAAITDAELMAMEQNRSLPIDQWMAVEAERGRRGASGAASGAASGGESTSVPSSAAPAPAPLAMSSAVPGTRASALGEQARSEDARIQAALAQLYALLVPGEALLAYAVQRRLFALTHRRVVVGATTGRFVSLSRGLFGGYSLHDVRWQDLRDATVRAGVFGATIGISTMRTEDLASTAHADGHPGALAGFSGLRKPQAEVVYSLCQAQEQVWREKRRVRDLDELRAESGGVQIGAGGGVVGTGASVGGDPMERLKRAKEMLDGGLISDSEYESIKARVVDGL